MLVVLFAKSTIPALQGRREQRRSLSLRLPQISRMLSDRDETLGVEKPSITDDNNTSFTSSDDGTGCNPFLEVLKSSMSSLLSSEGVDEVINEVPSIEVDVSSCASLLICFSVLISLRNLTCNTTYSTHRNLTGTQYTT